MNLDELYQAAVTTESDIWKHLPALRELARQSRVVAEFGVRTGISTVALLSGRPEKMFSYDLNPFPQYLAYREAAAPQTLFEFHQADSRLLRLPCAVDLLFVDTVHTYEHLYAELFQHAPNLTKRVAIHDTHIFGEQGEDLHIPGMNKAIEDFCAACSWRVKSFNPENYGLTVLERL